MPLTIPEVVTLVHELPKGDLCEVYEATMENGARVIVKVALDKANNDLVQTEARMLRRLFPPNAAEEKFYRYFPRIITSGTVLDKAYSIVSLALDTKVKEGGPEYISLATVIRLFPNGIDYRDAAWMFKRALEGLGWAHRKNVVHGNLTPVHILVHPIGHGAKLIDWSYAVLLKPDPVTPKPAVKEERLTVWERLMNDEDEMETILESEPDGPGHIKAITPAYIGYYPPEVMAKRVPTPATDLYTLAKTFVAVLGGNPATNFIPSEVPRHVRELLDEMLLDDPVRRLQDAWATHDRFDALLERLVGKPVYRPFRTVAVP